MWSDVFMLRHGGGEHRRLHRALRQHRLIQKANQQRSVTSASSSASLPRGLTTSRALRSSSVKSSTLTAHFQTVYWRVKADAAGEDRKAREGHEDRDHSGLRGHRKVQNHDLVSHGEMTHDGGRISCVISDETNVDSNRFLNKFVNDAATTLRTPWGNKL